MSLRNVDYTDRELLHLIAGVCDGDGHTTSDSIAAALGYSDNGKSRSRLVSTRLAWMARPGYGLLARVDTEEGPRWTITRVGEQIMAGRLTAAVEGALDKMDPGAQVLAMRKLTQRAYIDASDQVATVVRREWQHQAARRVR